MNAPHHPCFVSGYHDAQRGHTTEPTGIPSCAVEWRKGYDMATEAGEAELPRFGKLKRRSR